jgi:hypothetical protein
MSTTSIQKYADHQKIGRKILDLHDPKARIEHTTLEEITTTLEVAIQAEAEAGVETKTYLCITYSMREIHIIV